MSLHPMSPFGTHGLQPASLLFRNGRLARPGFSWAGLPVLGTRETWAVFSTDWKYRYVLGRRWSQDERAGCMFVVMLNPSDATHEVEDPTIRRCIGFAKREGYAGLVVRNLFAYRTPYPAKLITVSDPVGPDNRMVLEHPVEGVVIAAWGVIHTKLRAKAPRVPMPLSCFGMTKDGSPKHPLYLRSDTRIVALAPRRGVA